MPHFGLTQVLSEFVERLLFGKGKYGFRRFLNFLFVHHHFSELALHIHFCLIFVMLAERISRLAGGQNTDAVFHIGKINDTACGGAGAYFIKASAIIRKR